MFLFFFLTENYFFFLFWLKIVSLVFFFFLGVDTCFFGWRLYLQQREVFLFFFNWKLFFLSFFLVEDFFSSVRKVFCCFFFFLTENDFFFFLVKDCISSVKEVFLFFFFNWEWFFLFFFGWRLFLQCEEKCFVFFFLEWTYAFFGWRLYLQCEGSVFVFFFFFNCIWFFLSFFLVEDCFSSVREVFLFFFNSELFFLSFFWLKIVSPVWGKYFVFFFFFKSGIWFFSMLRNTFLFQCDFKILKLGNTLTSPHTTAKWVPIPKAEFFCGNETWGNWQWEPGIAKIQVKRQQKNAPFVAVQSQVQIQQVSRLFWCDFKILELGNTLWSVLSTTSKWEEKDQGQRPQDVGKTLVTP